MRVLIASNLDVRAPFGQSTRPRFLGESMAQAGAAIGNVGIDCTGIDFGPGWSLGTPSLRRRISVTKKAVAEFAPDVIYAHQTSPAIAALLAARILPVVADIHSLGSVEWFERAKRAREPLATRQRLAGIKARAGETAVVRLSRQLILAGEELETAVRSIWGARPHIVVVPNGADPKLIHSAKASTNPYESRGRFHAVATLPGGASPSNMRALEFLAEAADELSQTGDPTAIHILGCAEGPGTTRLQYEGFQEDLTPWLDHADVALLPYPQDAALFGGARNKLLEYLVRARAIVTTPEGLRGFAHAADWPGVYLADDNPRAFAEAIRASVAPEARTIDARLSMGLGWDSRAPLVLAALGAVARRPDLPRASPRPADSDYQ